MLDASITLIDKKKQLQIDSNSTAAQTFDLSTFFNIQGPVRNISFLSSASSAPSDKNSIKPRQQSSSMKWGQITENLVSMRTDGDLLIGQTKDGVQMYYTWNGTVQKAGDLVPGYAYAIGVDEQANRYGFAMVKGKEMNFF